MTALAQPATARVLIVDDNREELAVYSRWLRGFGECRFTVVTASSLATALEAYAASAPDCIVLDYDLRESTGLDVMAALAREGLRPAIVAMTGNGSEAIAVDFMKGGAGDYLSKSQMSAAGLCAAVMTQVSKNAMRRQLAVYRERERSVNAELAAALERASFLVESEKHFTGALDVEDTVTAGAAAVVPFLGQAAIVDLIEDGLLCRRAVHVDEGDRWRETGDQLMICAPTLVSATGIARTIRDGVPLYLSGEAFAQAARHDPDVDLLFNAGCVASAALPLSYHDLFMGVLTVGARRSFTDGEQTVLARYAERVAIAIANARMVESQRVLSKQSAASSQRFAFQSRISTLFARSLDWETALHGLMKLVTTSLSDSAAIFTVDAPAQQIRLVAAASPSTELTTLMTQYYRDYPPLLEDRAGTGRAVRTACAQFFISEVFAASSDPRKTQRQRELASKWSPISVIDVPLEVKGRVAGVLMLVRDRSNRHFVTEDAAVAEDIGRRTATYMENARLYEHQHGIASALQQALLPPDLPAVPELLFAVRYFAGAVGTDVGGDWYDVVNVNGERMVITIGDVVGRGVKAAAAMGQYRDILRAYAFEDFGPAAALTRLNGLVLAMGGDAFATCTVLVLDRRARRVTYASAGHPPVMLRLPGGHVAVLDAAGAMPIGAWPRTQYIEAAVDMPAGSTLFLYTDGLVETRQRSASDGVQLLRDALARSSADIDLMVDDVLRELAPDRSDDIAILAVEMLPPQSRTLLRWAFARIDRALTHTVRKEFDAIVAELAGPHSDAAAARAILGELLANVVRHAPGAFRVELDWSGEYAELRVFDRGPGFAVRDDFSPPGDLYSTSGRGLFLVSELSRALKIIRRQAGGIAVTAVLPVRRDLHARSLPPLAP